MEQHTAEAAIAFDPMRRKPEEIQIQPDPAGGYHGSQREPISPHLSEREYMAYQNESTALFQKFVHRIGGFILLMSMTLIMTTAAYEPRIFAVVTVYTTAFLFVYIAILKPGNSTRGVNQNVYQKYGDRVFYVNWVVYCIYCSLYYLSDIGITYGSEIMIIRAVWILGAGLSSTQAFPYNSIKEKIPLWAVKGFFVLYYGVCLIPARGADIMMNSILEGVIRAGVYIYVYMLCSFVDFQPIDFVMAIATKIASKCIQKCRRPKAYNPLNDDGGEVGSIPFTVTPVPDRNRGPSSDPVWERSAIFHSVSTLYILYMDIEAVVTIGTVQCVYLTVAFVYYSFPVWKGWIFDISTEFEGVISSASGEGYGVGVERDGHNGTVENEEDR